MHEQRNTATGTRKEKPMQTRTPYLNQYQKDHYVRVNLAITPEERSRWRTWAKAAGETLTGFIRSSLEARIQQEERKRKDE